MSTPPIRTVKDLRKNKPSPIPVGAPVRTDKPEVRKGPPLPAGQIIPASPASQKLFNDLNLEPGDYPPQLARVLEEQVRLAFLENPELAKEALPDGYDFTGHQLPPMKLIDISKMPAEYKKSVVDFVDSFRREQRELSEISVNQVSAAGKGVNDAIATTMRAEKRADKLYEIEGQPDADTPTASSPTTVSSGRSDPVTPLTSGGAAGGLAPRTHCPHCNHDLSQEDPLTITEDDLVAYVSSLVSGDRTRKEVQLLGGRIRVGFRSLTVQEADLAMRQSMIDAQASISDQLVPDTEELWGNLMSYRLSMGLEWIETPAQGRRTIAPLAEMQCDEPVRPNTRVKPYHDAVIQEFLPSENIRCIVGDAHHLFQLTLHKLNARAKDPKGWPPHGG